MDLTRLSNSCSIIHIWAQKTWSSKNCTTWQSIRSAGHVSGSCYHNTRHAIGGSRCRVDIDNCRIGDRFVDWLLDGSKGRNDWHARVSCSFQRIWWCCFCISRPFRNLALYRGFCSTHRATAYCNYGRCWPICSSRLDDAYWLTASHAKVKRWNRSVRQVDKNPNLGS